ncbi:hypothetical protein Dsin_008578 [Dipteronia sinensis]|nr:hypothetical protein Dsin_008578 [Dipteronia sinensis]
MDTDEIARLCDTISMNEKDNTSLILDVNVQDLGEQRLALCLVGKILTAKLVNKEVFNDVMNKIWRVDGGMEIEPIRGNIFAFYFRSEFDRQRILKGGPWSFDSVIIAFENPTGTGNVGDMNFSSVDF